MLEQQIYNLIKPFVQQDTIVARTVAEIKKNIDDFVVIIKDKTLIACCGVRKHNDCNEIYCLAIAKGFHGMGFAKQILQKAQQKVQQDNNNQLIASSKYKGEWFLTQGFMEMQIYDLPTSMQLQYNHSRSPRIFVKNICK